MGPWADMLGHIHGLELRAFESVFWAFRRGVLG